MGGASAKTAGALPRPLHKPLSTRSLEETQSSELLSPSYFRGAVFGWPTHEISPEVFQRNTSVTQGVTPARRLPRCAPTRKVVWLATVPGQSPWTPDLRLLKFLHFKKKTPKELYAL